MTAIALPSEVAAPERAAVSRLAPLDLMRGLVMVLMAIDHSSDAFNAGRLITDSAFLWTKGAPLPAAQFVTRWITHICAPTFVFLAGLGLAFTIQKERARGKTEREIDRQIFTRGAIIAAFEIWINVTVPPPGMRIFQVLYAIGVSFVLMVPLRRLSWRAAASVAALMIVGGEIAVGLLVMGFGGPDHVPLPLALLFVGGIRGHLIIAYPAIHWLAIMLLGYGFGLWLVERPEARHRLGPIFLYWGAAFLLVFAVVRGLNGYGNFLLYREDWSILQWLHVSKYPPCIAYTTLELGIMGLCLSAIIAIMKDRTPYPNGLLLVLGQTPMFFYILHFPMLVGTARLLGVQSHFGLGATYGGAAAVVALLYPACLWYRRYKAAHRDGWPRYI
jgi:uncharacterized membrane protein